MIVIVDYGVGNLTSIKNMVSKGGGKAIISSRNEDIREAQKLILPGMGHFDNCMQKFNSSGFKDIVLEKVFIHKVPVLGICVGLQMFMESSEEGTERGLNWVNGKTIRFQKERMKADSKVPNMGWLNVKKKKDSILLKDLENSRFYFAHLYHVVVEDEANVLLTSEYGYEFTVAVEVGNIIGVQFHPEKSHRFGTQLLKNFAEYY